MAITIPLKRKYVTGRRPKNIKQTDAGTGKRAGPNKVSWKKGTGTGNR